MPVTILPLFSTDKNTFSISHTGTTTTGVTVRNENPPSQLGSASILIQVAAVAPTTNITVTCQLLFSRNGESEVWGNAHNVLDDDGTAVFNCLTDTTFEANLYAQSWWKENNGFRIILTWANDRTTTVTGIAIIR